MDFCVINTISNGQRLSKDLRPTDNKEFGFAGSLSELDASVQRGDNLGIRRLEIRGTRENNEVASRHFALGAQIGFAPHEDVMAHGETAEMFKILGEMPGQPVVASDAAFLVNGGDERN